MSLGGEAGPSCFKRVGFMKHLGTSTIILLLLFAVFLFYGFK